MKSPASLAPCLFCYPHYHRPWLQGRSDCTLGGRGHSAHLLWTGSEHGGQAACWAVAAAEFQPIKSHFPQGKPDYALVHDAVVRIDPKGGNGGGTVTLALAPGFSFGKPVLYLSMEASTPDAAALEAATYAPVLEDIDVGKDDSAFQRGRTAFPHHQRPKRV